MTDDAAVVLVIDDERDIRDGVERFLTRMGCRVLKAPNGEEGLAVLQREPVWVVLLDLKMPGMDGMEVLPIIRRDHPEMVVIVITGFATLETAIQAMKDGAYDFIPKPFNPDQLRITVGRAIESIQLKREAERLAAERRLTLADLDAEKSRTRTIIRALPFGVVVTAVDGRVALMNPAFRYLVDLPPEAPVGVPLADYLPDPALQDMVGKIVDSGAGEPREGGDAEEDDASRGNDRSHELTTPGGRALLARGTPVVGEEGSVLGAVLVLVDLTPFKALDSMRSEFVAKVSHELRSPLSTIYLQLSLLLGEDQKGADSESRHLIARARERTEGLIGTVRDLLDLSRLEAGQGLGPAQEVPLAELLGRVVEGVRPQAEAKGQALELELPPGLPILQADPAALESVFTNLVNNAVKYTPDGGSVSVRAALDGGRVMVSVADNGLGIEAEKQDKVFEKFYRVKNQDTIYITGTGLGLSIVKSIVDSLGGEITLESEPGVGSTFAVFLPLPA